MRQEVKGASPRFHNGIMNFLEETLLPRLSKKINLEGLGLLQGSFLGSTLWGRVYPDSYGRKGRFCNVYCPSFSFPPLSVCILQTVSEDFSYIVHHAVEQPLDIDLDLPPKGETIHGL